jgi:UDP-GlcNAc3NAcA epimerase
VRIVSVVGTRPQLIKAAALSPVLRTRHDEIFVDTGQHYDEALAGAFFTELGLPRPDHSLGIGGGSPAEQTGGMLAALEPIIAEAAPDAVLVYGDTNSTLAGALAAAKLHVPVAHVEAGLRSFDRRMPEEINRIVADHLSRWLFVPTPAGLANLANEGLTDGVELVGDLMLDLAARISVEVRDPSVLTGLRPGGLKLSPGHYLFATIHRAENRAPEAVAGWADLLRAVARPYRPVVLALHPGTRAALEASGEALGDDVTITEPLGYRSSLALQLHAAAVLTDSGGVQREAGWLRVPCLVLRESTEWIELVAASEGRMVLVGLDTERAVTALARYAPVTSSTDLAQERAHTLDLAPAGAAEAIAAALARAEPAAAVVAPAQVAEVAVPVATASAARSLRVTFITANTFEYDSRTLRAAQALAADGHRVTVVALQGPGLPAEETLPGGIRVVRPKLDRRIAAGALAPVVGLDAEATALPPRGSGLLERVRAPLRRFAEILAYRRRIGPWAEAAVAAAPADIYSAKALVALPVARAAAERSGGRFVYDVADLHVESGRLAAMPGPVKAYLRGREGGWMSDAAGLTTVTEPLADELVRRFGSERPVVVMNCRPRWRPEDPNPPTSERLRAAIAAAAPTSLPDAPILLYQGSFREDQGIEELLTALTIEPLRDVPVTAVFLGFGRLEAKLREAAAASPGRIVVLPPVPSEELLEWTAGADLSFVGAPPKTINLTLTIPNKLFESMMAGVPVVVAGETAVAALVASAGVGAVVTPWTPEAIAATIAGLLSASPDERQALRQTARTAALERYNGETEARGLVELYRRLAGPA